jgi:ketosteroid isomerase-like protein
MKIRYLLALVGLVIVFTLPAFAQQKNSVDPQIAEQLSALSKKTDESYINGDAAALAALYTEDALLLTNTGPIYGREAIEKHFADVFQKVHYSKHLDARDQSSPHIIGTIGKEAWSNGQWSLTSQVKGGDPVERNGYWLEVYHLEGDTWKRRVDAWNVTPAPAPQTTTTDLVGTWKLVSITIEQDGKKTDFYGPNPQGQLIYEANGRVSNIITRSGLPKFASDSRQLGTPEENAEVVEGSIAYFGTYTVDAGAKTITLHIETCSYPNLNGLDRKSTFNISGDELTITNPTSSIGVPDQLVWKRVK